MKAMFILAACAILIIVAEIMSVIVPQMSVKAIKGAMVSQPVAIN